MPSQGPVKEVKQDSNIEAYREENEHHAIMMQTQALIHLRATSQWKYKKGRPCIVTSQNLL